MMEEMLTVEDWKEYIDSDNLIAESMLLGYLDANDGIINTIEKILNTATNFNELKTQLTAFVDKQKYFKKHIDEKWNMKYIGPQ